MFRQRFCSRRQNVDAYATNIDGFGHRLDPAIDFDADDADRRVGECIYLERLAARDRGDLPTDAELEPTEDEISQRRQELVHLARTERARLTSFFEFCSFDHSFVELRRRTRQTQRSVLAVVERSGYGARDDRGAFSRGLSGRELATEGVGFPPFHGLCRTTTLPEG